MVKNFQIALLFCFISYVSNIGAQDSSYHCIGLGGSYFPDPDKAGLRGELNLNYAFSYDHFFLKIESGISPFTNFGPVIRLYPTLGICTEMKSKLIWHLGIGVGVFSGTKRYDHHDFYGFSPICNTGFLISPLRSKKLIFGLDATAGRYTLHPHYPDPTGPLSSGARDPFKSFIFFLNFSVYCSIKKQHVKIFKYVD